MFLRKIMRRLVILMMRLRILVYKFLSLPIKTTGKPNIVQPTLFLGEGFIKFGNSVQLGYFPSPSFLNNYIHIEARYPSSEIIFGDNIYINNACRIIAGYHSIKIGNNVMIGTNCEIINNDFHDQNATNRINGDDSGAKGGYIVIGNNVFIGSNVTIMKNVVIGDNSIIGNGSVLTKSIDKNSVAAGNPAVIIKSL